MPSNYNPSQASLTIQVLAPIGTTTTIQAYGSADGYTTPNTEFGTDEQIAIGGTLVASNGANLTGVQMGVYRDGVLVGNTALYGFAGGVNYYQLNIGILTQGQHTIEARFPKTRV